MRLSQKIRGGSLTEPLISEEPSSEITESSQLSDNKVDNKEKEINELERSTPNPSEDFEWIEENGSITITEFKNDRSRYVIPPNNRWNDCNKNWKRRIQR